MYEKLEGVTAMEIYRLIPRGHNRTSLTFEKSTNGVLKV